jgi:hypothetical protein
MPHMKHQKEKGFLRAVEMGYCRETYSLFGEPFSGENRSSQQQTLSRLFH